MGFPSRPVPSRPVPSPSSPVPSRPAESAALRTLITIPPSPVHSGRPGRPWTWILSNHSANPAFGGFAVPGENGRRYSNAKAALRPWLPLARTLRAALSPEARSVPARGQLTGTGWDRGGMVGVVYPHHPPCHPGPVLSRQLYAGRDGTGLWAQRRRGVQGREGVIGPVGPVFSTVKARRASV